MTTCMQHLIFLFIVMFCFLGQQTDSSSVQLASGNINDILKNNNLVLVNFYADWCRFSQMLAPVYDNAAKKVKEEFPGEGVVEFGKVDCDRETGIAQQYHVSKYPTIKMFRHGELVKREYRGQRSVEAISSFIREQLRDTIVRVQSLEELDEIDKKKRNIIGYFADDQSGEFEAYRKVAGNLREDCTFYAAIGEMSEPERIVGNKIVFRAPGEDSKDLVYAAGELHEEILMQWTTDKCVPLVREITFENAEELTEEGLPFMILFHAPDDTETPEIYRTQVGTYLVPEKTSINFLTADGTKFTHPLYHLGKTVKDLPILSIDSFRHMYLWKNNPKTDLQTPGLLKQFIADLHSGKLHREFHHGPDPTTTESADAKKRTAGGDKAAGGQEQTKNIPKNGDVPEEAEKPKQPTSPPESTFKKLAPSKNRYTLLRDEL